MTYLLEGFNEGEKSFKVHNRWEFVRMRAVDDLRWGVVLKDDGGFLIFFNGILELM